MAKYEACIAGMEALQELGVKETEVFGDSTLVIAQAQKLLKVKEEHLKPYQQYLEDLTKTFDKIEYTIIPRAQKQFAGAMATLGSMVEILKGVWCGHKRGSCDLVFAMAQEPYILRPLKE